MGNEASRGLSPSPYGVPPASPSPLRRAKSFSQDTKNGSSTSSSSPQLDRSIQRMDKTIRKRVRGGITYNMKIILRGDRGTGKTSLFQRLKGAPIPSSHEPTPQLQSATINWSFRANSEESVKCDVWDVVDKGFVPVAAAAEPGDADETNPFETAGAATNGAHLVATVDATTVDVYHETHGVVFLLDVTKPHTLEYVRQHLDQVPVHIPTLVLGNFRDLGAQRKIFKEDIQELLYGGATQHQPVRRPQELLYFECSLLNCYGLKSLHQYFGIPFLQLKQQTIRQQLRIVEGEFTHLKHDLQAKIAEQKYADYLDHIKATGSDIRTGRRAAAAAAAAVSTKGAGTPPLSPALDADAASETKTNGEQTLHEDSPTAKARLDRTLSSSSDIVVHSETAPSTSAESPVGPPHSTARQVDLEDLPERTAALAQAGNNLKIDYTEEERRASKRQLQMPPLPGMSARPSTSDVKNENEDGLIEENAVEKKSGEKQRAQSAATTSKPIVIAESDVTMNLEDFQVPKPRYNDLDSFYSEDESEDEAGDDDDVVISTASARLAKAASAKFHKQQFLDSDDSDSDGEKHNARGKNLTALSANQRSPRRHLTKPSTEVQVSTAGTSTAGSNGVVPSPPSPVRPPPAVVSPRLPASPPRPTASPQHSPRRRVKEAINTHVEETHDEELHSNSGESVPVKTPVQESPVQEDFPIEPTSVEQNEATAVQDDDSDCVSLDQPASVLEREAIDTESQATATEAPTRAMEAIEPGAAVVEGPLDTEAGPLTSLSKAGHSIFEEVSDPKINPGSIPATPDESAVIQDHVEDDVEAIVAASADDIEGFFSDKDDEPSKFKPDDEQNQTATVEDDVELVRAAAGVAEPQNGATLDSLAPSITNELPAGEDSSIRGSGIVSQLKQQHQAIELTLTDDDLDEPPKTKPTPPTKASSKTRHRKVEMLMSDSEDSDSYAPPPPYQQTDVARAGSRPQSISDLTSIPSPPLAPVSTEGSGKLGDILEAFLNDSGSDSDGEASKSTVTKPTVAVESDEDDEEEEADRFAAYNMKRSTQRRSKSSRKKQFGDLSTTTPGSDENATGSLSSPRTSSFSATSGSTAPSANIANQDVLAAIRMAEQDALRMLEESTSLPTRSTTQEYRQHEEPATKEKKKSSIRSSSRRSKEENVEGDESGKKKKTKKKKEKEGGSSSRSKRREMIMTDEDE